jgi:hypothetical protein
MVILIPKIIAVILAHLFFIIALTLTILAIPFSRLLVIIYDLTQLKDVKANGDSRPVTEFDVLGCKQVKRQA